ncbi:MAG: DEAD/DEAH box helicase family protein [SAR324 cluster bacterium]|nr:DEAD/DEAH box helicase family protein [SAR324 cluster bacterium]
MVDKKAKKKEKPDKILIDKFFSQIAQYHEKAPIGEEVRQAVLEFPESYELLLLNVMVCLFENKTGMAFLALKKIRQIYRPHINDYIMEALAYVQKGGLGQARQILESQEIDSVYHLIQNLYGGMNLREWLLKQFNPIFESGYLKKSLHGSSRKPDVTPSSKQPSRPDKPVTPPGQTTPSPLETLKKELEEKYALPPVSAKVQTRMNLNLNALTLPDPAHSFSYEEQSWFQLRHEFLKLGLLRGFDELLCLPALHNVDTYWYQVETVRKVLKRFRGRVLLADEVGLGKTIEAGMILKEYVLRGMADRVLILTPASLVGQWQEEMSTKFGLAFETSYNALMKNSPEQFWACPRIIASIASARRAEHFNILTQMEFDLVIVDEAHHLKNRNTQNWKLVDALQKRFLLLLSATPVQNSLVELYNLLTLLKPGIFKTEKEFKSSYMVTGKPRVPANRDQMRELMREVMIRNTRSLVDVKLPLRHAMTMILEPETEEFQCYQELHSLVQESWPKIPASQRMALHMLLSSAGSSPVAACSGLTRFIEKHKGSSAWEKLAQRYQKCTSGIKDQSLMELLDKNPAEKKMIFVHHLSTMEHLCDQLKLRKLPFSVFHGGMSGPEKDQAIEDFREQTTVLVCTESGGEGRNVQFCNTLINYDIPWNPMQIEQRIGRIHRIGQKKEVFIFNLAVKGTLEEQVLRILDEKINMFELVVGEIGAILGELEEETDFAERVFNAWIETTDEQRTQRFDELAEQILSAKTQYEDSKSLDNELFGEDFETG